MLSLDKQSLDLIFQHCIKEMPNEACGILAGLPAGQAGRNTEVEKVYPMANSDKSPATYFMDPKEQLKVTKQIRNEGLEMIGIYHSHVASRPYPSAHDIELAYYPEVSYVIVSVRNKDNPEIKSFRIVDGKISEEDIKVI